MFVVNEDLSIYATRGDIVCLNVSAKDDRTGEAYEFQPGDIVQMMIYRKKNAEDVVMQKDFPVPAKTNTVGIFLTEQDTKIGNTISKPTDYWYQVTLNPYTNPQTFIGYDDDGAKIFKLFPEGKDITKDEPTKPEDIPVVDEDLSLLSSRPVENKAIARAITLLKNDMSMMDSRLTGKIKANKKIGETVAEELAVERARIDNLVSGATADGAEVVDIRVGADGVTYETAGKAVRGQISDLNKSISDICYKSLNILDFSKAMYGKEMDVAGNIKDNEKAILFDRFITVKRGDTVKIAFNKRFNWSGNYGMVKRPDGAFAELLTFKENEDGNWATEFTVAANSPDEYRTISFCILTDTQTFNDASPETSLMCVINAEMPKEFWRYGRYITEENFSDNLWWKIKNLYRFTNWYDGKRVCAFGDSITAMGYWFDYVKDYLGIAEIVNKGIGGTTVYNNGQVLEYDGKTQNAWMCSDERIASLPDDIDVLLVMGGMNDWGNNIEIGTMASRNDTPDDGTFVGAYQLMLTKLQKKYPNAKIFTMTTTNGRVWNYGENLDVPPQAWGRTIRDIADATMMVSRNYGIPCIDLNGECGFSFVNSDNFLQDAVHPNNETGAKAIANAIINGLKRFEPIDM